MTTQRATTKARSFTIGTILLISLAGCGDEGDDAKTRGALTTDDVILDTDSPQSDADGTGGSDESMTPDNGSDEDTDMGNDPDDDTDMGDDPNCSSDCEFTTYNLDVQVGDVFVLSNFVECGGAADFVFEYEGGEDWNLASFNADVAVTITDADLAGGNKGEGEYRLNMLDASGEELDHMTIRINHGDESDITAADAQPPTRSTTDACGGEPDVPAGINE